ncbi:Conserved oligomeric Golgi complex subunit 3 [Escovopsis weberi]|uniref:Conserved oligomeric Golgi complex subunit 3 n=1 Tax=Escovopsis weberi TaxID=150374 RepID=A0A0M8MZG0_ESCWE|nr:Conserved oligomeric Golgi complex subunit 3 [Escovopsis weberi]
MFEDGWYSIVPELTSARPPANPQPRGHHRTQSLLQQSAAPGEGGAHTAESLAAAVLREVEESNVPSDPEVPPRPASCSDVRGLLARAAPASRVQPRSRRRIDQRARGWDALALCDGEALAHDDGPLLLSESHDDQLLEESQREYLLYRDQLKLTERHLDGLIHDASEALRLLTTLSTSFQSVDAQTASFQEQCEGLVVEQKRLEKLADEVGTDLHYYAFLETATRRLNAPGASRLVDDDDFGDMIANIDSCIAFMIDHENYRERDSYLARFDALLTKALHLLDHGFTTHLQKVMTQSELQEYQKEVKSASIETATRNFIKQSFERTYNEDGLFSHIFDLEPIWNASPGSAFQSIKAISTAMVHPGNLTPLATTVLSVLQNAQLQEVCSVAGWLASEYSIAVDVDEEESLSFKKHREYAARLLADHLWTFTDNAFDAEVTKSISKAVLRDDSLQLGPVVDGVASSNAHPIVKRAMELLAMFDGAMPKERSTKNSSIVFKIVRETVQVLQRAEARIKYLRPRAEADLFMVKNLLILRNVLVSLEIGDIRSQPPSMQHLGVIWDALSPQTWVSFFGNIIGSQLWSRSEPSVSAKSLSPENMSEQLDEILRQSIVGFTGSWATALNNARSGKAGAKPVGEVEAALEKHLRTAFSNQPEIIEKFQEAIQLNASGIDKPPNGSMSLA